MAKEWAPSRWGMHLTGSSDWRLRLKGLDLALTLLGHSHRVNVEDETTYRVQAGTFWTDITFYPGQEREVKADGLPNAQGATLVQALNVALTEQRLRRDLWFLQGEQQKIDRWLEQKADQERACAEQRRWLTHEQQDIVLAARPTVNPTAVRSRLQKAGVVVRLGAQAKAIERALTAWEADYRPAWAALNAAHVARELVACKNLLDRVESKPLTEEQARAVVYFDNRVQVVASAGSGKTSTMVAKAAYAIHRGFVTPERILLLAFNKQAAEELKERAAQAFERLGMEGVTVEASTFHALGLRLIGKATKEKPDIPDWATDATSGVRKLTEIVDQLKDGSLAFRRQWDLFRFVFGRNLPAFGSPEPADVWDAQGKGALVTNRGERVKSLEEVMIANFLFLNGVEYHYEAPYPHRTADEAHRQYRPDFYYPDLDLFHEHFALDAHGVPPPHFENYLEGVLWKRQLHAEKGTTLFETTSHGLRHGDDFERLERELTARGVLLDPNPDREIPEGGQKPMESIELIGLIRTFMSHAKSNGLSIPALQQQLDAMPQDIFKHRHQRFLDIAAPILAAWDQALAAEGGIDFEDMLNLAAGHLESGRVESPYDLVMADEFQDASRARARLCRALVQPPGRFFFAVGDDWQSINRFAGADVGVMTGFREWFGHGQVLKLEQTFRCPQALCDVSSAFVSKNPAQIPKRVHSATPAQGPVLQAFQVHSKDQLADAIDRFVMTLAEGVREGTIPTGRSGKVSVYVLGRYNTDKQYVTANQRRLNRWVDISFLTIHRSKGSEADYVILPEMLSVLKGRSFPNTRTDDPVLALAMPDGDNFPLGEERRLFYVALTRARRTVAMFTVKGRCSTFLRELEDQGALVLTDTDGKAVKEDACPACKQGVLVLRSGPYGEFRSCSNYPSCHYKPRRHWSTPAPVVPRKGKRWLG
ncbi:UvrD-helicase domain-containing protein [Hydrogenophaga sp. BPS33]|uniref:UvrD-helicase domain-containing protein n=1 Tax=Hydrogenophaga sp. BPS33 TaxID=2651974 RepID=UPI001320428B|nr:UvrD-helicase domain-containing protein [Hydrogenophaga sp. BPS33]QHE87216.1 AAA family ATPase [Hydrogenophaga sp. BPS33]